MESDIPKKVKENKVVPLSDFAYGEPRSDSRLQVDPPEEDESFQVRSESENVFEDQMEDEEEMSDIVTSDDDELEEEDDELMEEESCQDKENCGDTIPARSDRPRRATRTKINYVLDDEDEDEDEHEDMMIVEESDGASLQKQGDKDAAGQGDESIDSETNVSTEMSDEALINESREGLTAVESILHHRRAPGGKKEMRVKFCGTSYRKTAWVERENLEAVGKQSLLRGYDKRLEQGRIDPYGDLEEGVHPEWCKVERILGSREGHNGTEYLVKWCGLNYSDSTWEHSEDLCSDEDKESLKQYTDRKLREEEKVAKFLKGGGASPQIDVGKVPTFCNSRKLRDYQLESLKWMVQNWYSGKNCILGDEMGLGKTAQSIACIEYQRQFGEATDPFLIVAPLTTLGHWKREIETWTNMNCVLYCGNAKDKKIIQTYEMWCEGADNLVKPDVILSSFEHVMRDSGVFQSISWETMIIDEAHRMKGTKGATRTCIAGIECQWILLLTGTPVQNNVKELFGLLNLLDPKQYSDEDEFLNRFGRSADKMTPSQVHDLQRSLKPILLRRMKEDVENLPEKEECIIWVQLTREQRAYYKAIFENQIGALLGGSSAKNIPALRNVAMELRKVCCHPYLCDGVEDDITARNSKDQTPLGELDLLVSSCGKMQLIHKLLPKLRAEKRKVLIFSQFKIMLNVMEDYCNLMDYPVERIDGSTASRDRQASIDRFSSTDKDGFVFLLSTKAGGQGITLTAADTCILYDSDWNPQNDLQAMARCHRIGQSKDVTIYRLVSKDTYEENLFRASSRKYGLDEAILGGLGANQGSDGNPEYDGKRISELLKHGAHCLKDAAAANKETDAFSSENIDEILTRRTEKRQIGGRAGNSFSVASFGQDTKSSKAEDTEFWKSVLPKACATFENKKNQPSSEILPPRKKRSVNYSEKKLKSRGKDDDFEFEFDDAEDEGEKNQPKKAKVSKSKVKKWTAADLNKLLEHLLRYGMNLDRFKAWEGGLSYFRSKKYNDSDVMEVAEILRESLLHLAERVPRRQRNSGYIVSRDATPEQLEIADRAYLKSLKKYDRMINDITDYFLEIDLPKIVVRICSKPRESGFKCDRKLFFRLASFAHNMCDHIFVLDSIKKRIIDEVGKPIPPVNIKGTPTFWARYKQNDLNLLKAIYYHGWDWCMRISSKQLEDLVHILRTGEDFSNIRTLFIGTETAPPETEDFMTKEKWLEQPDSGYFDLAQNIYLRIKKISDGLLEWRRFAQLSKMDCGGFSESDGMAPKPDLQGGEEMERQPDVVKDDLKTPKQESAALDVFRDTKEAFTGPTPSIRPQSNLKANCRQKSIFEAFKIDQKPAEQPVVDVDLTYE